MAHYQAVERHVQSCVGVLESAALNGPSFAAPGLAREAWNSIVLCLSAMSSGKSHGIEESALRRVALAAIEGKNGAMVDFCVERGFDFKGTDGDALGFYSLDKVASWDGSPLAGVSWLGMFARHGFLEKARGMFADGLLPSGHDPYLTGVYAFVQTHPFAMALEGPPGTAGMVVEPPFCVSTKVDGIEKSARLLLDVVARATEHEMSLFFGAGNEIGAFFEFFGKEEAIELLAMRTREDDGDAKLRVVAAEAKKAGFDGCFSLVCALRLEWMMEKALADLPMSPAGGVLEDAGAQGEFERALDGMVGLVGLLAKERDGVKGGMRVLDKVTANFVGRKPEWLADRSSYWERVVSTVSDALNGGVSMRRAPGI